MSWPAEIDRVVLIADVGADAGLGHLARTSALGAALLARSAKVSALGLGLPQPTERYGVRWLPAAGANYQGACAIVLDSYHADRAFRAALRAIAPLIVFSDDEEPPDDADLCVDSGGSGSSRRPGWISGPSYACVGPPYWAIAAHRPPPRVRRVLVATGGRDPSNAGAELAGGLRDAIPGVTVRLVRGPRSAQTTPELVELASAPATLDRELQRCDLVVCSAGQTLLEALAAGVPAVALAVAVDQRRQLETLIDAGAALPAATPCAAVKVATRLASDLKARRRLSAAARIAVDGRGALRVANEVLALCPPLKITRSIQLRPATRADASLLLSWRNDPITRRFSFTKHKITTSEHSSWLDARLSDHNTLIWIAVEGDRPVGQARLTRSDDEAEIHLVVAPSERGLGYGRAIIQLAVTSGVEGWPTLTSILARIECSNLASIQAFETAGFRRDPEAEGRFVLELGAERGRA